MERREVRATPHIAENAEKIAAEYLSYGFVAVTPLQANPMARRPVSRAFRMSSGVTILTSVSGMDSIKWV